MACPLLRPIAVLAPLFPLLAALAAATPAAAQTARNPLGEHAYYVVDRDRSRTSALVRDGHLSADVDSFQVDDTAGPEYHTALDWQLKLNPVGTRAGNQAIQIPEIYFSPQFIVDLRANGAFESPRFKARHMGYGDATDRNGTTYPHCDIVYIYDIDAKTDAGAGKGDRIEGLAITAHVAQGVPVIGAVLLDITGKFEGAPFKAGADYAP